MLFKGRLLSIHPHWNMQYAGEKVPYAQLNEVHANAFAHPSIIHFIGPKKPWSTRLHASLPKELY